MKLPNIANFNGRIQDANLSTALLTHRNAILQITPSILTASSQDHPLYTDSLKCGELKLPVLSYIYLCFSSSQIVRCDGFITTRRKLLQLLKLKVENRKLLMKYKMKIGGVLLAVAILVSFCSGSYASVEGQAFAQTEVYGARKDWTIWSAVVVGKVFCDQCIQNNVFPFAHPMSNAKVSVQCKDKNGKVVDYAQASTNFLGDFIVNFKGKKDLTGCSVYLTGSPDGKCNIVGGGGKTLSLKSKFLFKAMYIVDPLFYKPSKPMGFCPRKGPSPGRSHGGITIPFPNRRPSTCSCLDWLRPDYKCYWPKDMSPWKTTVGSVFGKGAQKKYGYKTLASGLLTGDELLRQAIAALLNSRTNKHFYMSPRGIKSKFSKALYGSWKAKSAQVQAFKDANNGYGKGKCLLVSCKW